MTAHTREGLRDDIRLLSHTATLQHCLLPHCAIAQLGILGRVSRQLHQLTQKEFSVRAASLWRALEATSIRPETKPDARPEMSHGMRAETRPAASQATPVAPARPPTLGHPAWDSTTFRLLLRDLPRLPRPLSAIQRLNLLMQLASRPEWLQQLDRQQRKHILLLTIDTLKMPGGIVPCTVKIVMELGQLEPVQLHLTPAQRATFWICLTEEAFDTVPLWPPARELAAAARTPAGPAGPQQVTQQPRTHPQIAATTVMAAAPPPVPQIPRWSLMFLTLQLKRLLKH